MNDLYKAIDALNEILQAERTEQELEERVTYSTLAKLSGIENPDKIYPGQKITLPGGGSYTVKGGDTLSGIAQDYRLGNIGKKDDFKGLDDPKTRAPQVPSKLGPDGQYDGDDLGNAPTTPNKLGPDGKYSGDDLGNAPTTPEKKPTPVQYPSKPVDNDMLNKYDKINKDEYKLDTTSIKPAPAYNKMDKPVDIKTASNDDAALAAKYAQMTNPNLNVKPVVTPSASSAEKAIGKAGEKAASAIKTDIDKSYTKKGVSSLYDRLKDLF